MCAWGVHGTRPSYAVRLLSVAIDDRAQMDGVLAGAGAPETAPMAPKLTRSLSGDKPWRCYEESYTQARCLLGRHLLWPGHYGCTCNGYTYYDACAKGVVQAVAAQPLVPAPPYSGCAYHARCCATTRRSTSRPRCRAGCRRSSASRTLGSSRLSRRTRGDPRGRPWPPSRARASSRRAVTAPRRGHRRLRLRPRRWPRRPWHSCTGCSAQPRRSGVAADAARPTSLLHSARTRTEYVLST